MDRLIYTALTGLQRTQEAQAVTAHNLANLPTPGFKREMATLEPGWLVSANPRTPARVQAGGEAPVDLLDPGSIEVTDRPLDIAMVGDAWLTVEGANGDPAFTRRGDLRVQPDGQLVTGSGQRVLGIGGPIQLPADFASVQIARDGTLSIQPPDDSQWVEVGQLLLQTPPRDQLTRGVDGLFHADWSERDESATVHPGALERSNMSAATALVELVEQSRLFEMQTRLVTAAKEMDEGTAALMRVQ